MEKVSIIIPIYNIKEYMSDSVNSAMMQTYKDIEIILVDDGSTDGSGEMCDEYGEKDSRIKVIHKENGGLSSARNAGLDAAEGEYILFLDGDDYLALNAAEYALSIAKRTDADIIQYGYIETIESFTPNHINGTGGAEVIKDTKSFYGKLYEIGGEAASACTKLYKRSMFDRFRFKEGILHEDEELITRQLREVGSIAYIPDKLYYYVTRKGSIIRSDFNLRRLDFFAVGKERIKMLRSLGYSDILETEYDRYFSGLLNYYCTARKRNSKEGCAEIKRLLKEYYQDHNHIPNGKMRLFYYICRINPDLVEVYYLLRKHFGHIE